MEKSPLAKNVTLPAPESLRIAPHGRDEIISVFGDINEYVGTDGQLEARWHVDYLERVSLPFPLRVSWDPARAILQMTCHRRLTSIFAAAFGCIQERGLQAKITSFGGCFAFRPQRTGGKLSAHSWGIAIDLNPETNPQGSAGNMDAGIIEIFRRAGFEWGGDWQGKNRDPMHFQFCTGYCISDTPAFLACWFRGRAGAWV
jgi:D-alanyl-D-alanine carboxypeptidase